MDAKKLISEIKSIVIIVFFALLFRSVLYEPWQIPTESMYPTLIVGDRVVINKNIYGISRYSFPFSPPIIKGRFFERAAPQRGDVIVFENDKVYIKRVIGLPGDEVQMINGVVYLNNEPLKKELIEENYTQGDVVGKKYRETLPGGYSYEILDINTSESDNTQMFKVPEGSYFVMGDNRDNSNDSRSQDVVSFVESERILGKANILFFSSAEYSQPIKFFTEFKKERLFKKIV